MSDVVSLDEHRRLIELLGQRADASFDTFLLEEGLALLAAYRTIGDLRVRASLRDMIVAVASADGKGG